MNRIDTLFQKKKPFIAYLTAGDGNTVETALALVEGGVDCLEIGVPFSDPVADGPVIQRAMQRAQNVNLETCLEIVAQIRKHTEVPIILFSYFNPIFQRGPSFFEKCKQAGCDGLLIVDLPIYEANEWSENIHKAGLHLIYTVSPSTEKETLDLINQRASGFLYYVSRKGITGMQKRFPNGYAASIQRIKQAVSLPVVTGFGISNPAMAKEALQNSDGFVVGSYFVSAIEKGYSLKELIEITKEMNIC